MGENNGCDLGLIGLGVMGRNFLLNLADHGFAVAGYDLEAEKARQLQREKSSGHDIHPAEKLGAFIDSLKRPRAVMLLVPAGKAVDAVLEQLVPSLGRGDLIIDGGNSHFGDTDRRARKLEDEGLLYLGTGISGGEYGARHGPSIMPGGSREGYERVSAMLEKAAARAKGEPCVSYLGSGSAGHYVKMVHNGIEYAFMQLIAETYDFMKSGLGLSAPELRGVFEEWNRSELESYLIEITARIFDRTDEKTGRPLIDRILDAARQKGTGKWMSQEAMELQVPTPTIDAAVMMRNLSSHKQAREKIGGVFSDPGPKLTGSRRERLGQLKDALYAGLILTFAQGMNLLRKASEQYGYGLDPAAVSRIWRGGCIIRAALLEDVRSAYEETPDLENLMLHPKMAEALKDRQTSLRQVTAAAVQIGVPFAAFASSTGYFDGYRRARLPANLIQAQRDYFGSHRYERVDGDGMFHTRWREQ